MPHAATVGEEVTSWFGRDLAALTERARRARLDRAFTYWRQRGFPYPNLDQSEMEAEFCRLRKTSLMSVQRAGLVSSTVGLRLANSFHPQMWHVPLHGRSPAECFEDDEVLHKSLQKAIRFWPNRRCWNEQCIRSVMRIYRRSRVSNFRPTAARSLIAQFSRDGDTVLDFSAGYGGRLLGAMTLDRHYIGVDPAEPQIKGLRRMQASLANVACGSAEIRMACAEECLPDFPSRSVDLLVSSPPYYDLEKYTNEDTQSWRRYRTYAEWRDRFLKPVLFHGSRALRRGGFLIINVVDLPRAPLAQDTLSFLQPKLGRAVIRKLWLSTAPTERASGGRSFRWEPLLIFQRGG